MLCARYIYYADLMYYRQNKSVAMATVINREKKRTTDSVPICFNVQIRFPVSCGSEKTLINKSEARFIGRLTFQQVIHG